METKTLFYLVEILLTILYDHASYFFFFIIELYILIPSIITQIFNPVAEIVIPIGIPNKEMETNPVIVEISVSQWSI